MITYCGSCHCGNVKFSFEHEPISNGVRCNCSLCKRKAAVMSDFTLTTDQLRISAESKLADYRFGNQIAHHYFCRQCGIYPFHQTLSKPGEYRVNLGCVDEIDIFQLEIRVLDGKHLPD